MLPNFLSSYQCLLVKAVVVSIARALSATVTAVNESLDIFALRLESPWLIEVLEATVVYSMCSYSGLIEAAENCIDLPLQGGWIVCLVVGGPC